MRTVTPRRRKYDKSVTHPQHGTLAVGEGCRAVAMWPERGPAGLARVAYEYVAGKHHIDGGLGLGLALRHDDAFAGGQPISFHDDRRAVRTDMGFGGS